MSHRAEKFRRGTLLCFTEFLVSKIFLERKGLGEYQEFPSKYFCLTLPKNFVGERFCDVFKKNSGSEKAFRKKGGREYQDFPSKTFCLTVLKNFLGEHFCAVFQKFFVSEFFMDKRGGGSGFAVEIFLSQRPEKIHRGTLLCCVSGFFW